MVPEESKIRPPEPSQTEKRGDVNGKRMVATQLRWCFLLLALSLNCVAAGKDFYAILEVRSSRQSPCPQILQPEGG